MQCIISYADACSVMSNQVQSVIGWYPTWISVGHPYFVCISLIEYSQWVYVLHMCESEHVSHSVAMNMGYVWAYFWLIVHVVN